MCVVSMVIDHYGRKPPDWWEKYNPLVPYGPNEFPSKKELDQDKIQELIDLLKEAKKYDEENHEPDCETEAKKKTLKELADFLGIEIDFI